MAKTRIAIAGFGEIGATVAVIAALDNTAEVDVAQIFNRHLSPEDACARVMYSRYVDPDDLSFGSQLGEGYIGIRGKRSMIVRHDSIEDAASQLSDIDVVVFTIGEYTKDPAFMKPFLREGRAKAVVVTCETPAADYLMVPGFNHHLVNLEQHRVIALGSCTGNCAVPILSILEEQFGEGSIRGVYAVAPHSKTNTQEIGNKGADPKKEGLLGNLIPTSTGLSKLLQYPGFFQLMSDSVEAVSVRTPTEDVSLLCMDVDIEGGIGADTVSLRHAFQQASQSARWRGIVGYDRARGTKVFWKDRHACVIFEPYVKMREKFLRHGERAPLCSVNIMAAYANVYGYSSQVIRAVSALGLGRPVAARSEQHHEEQVMA